MKNALTAAFIATGLFLSTTPLQAQMTNPVEKLAAQRIAMSKLAYLDGMWRGSVTTTLPNGNKLELTQTERVGPFLDGAIRLIEGRGHEADGRVSFNALGTISFDDKTGVYSLHSNAQGYVGDFVLAVKPDGFIWEIPAGPMTLRYTATIKDNVWHEVGDRLVPGKDPVRFLEMSLKRVGDTSWPAAGAVPLK